MLGYLADKSSSRRTPLLLGFISTAAATGLLYLARSVWLLLLSRFFQGLAASVVYAVGFALLADTVPPEDIGYWMGFAIASLNVGMIISPSLGGILYDNFGYGSLFSAVFALVAIDIFLRLVMVEKKTLAALHRSDGETQPEYGTIEPCSGEFSHEQRIPESTTISAVNTVAHEEEGPLVSNLMSTTVMDQSAHKNPLLTLLTSARILTDLYGAFVTVFVLVGFDSAIPIFVKREFGWTSTGAGLIFLFITTPILLGPFAGRLSDRYPSALLTALWFLLSAGFIVLLNLVTYDRLGSVAPPILLCSLLTLYGRFLPRQTFTIDLLY